LSDKGGYATTTQVTISHGGLPGAPVTIMGVNSAGAASDITITGTRDSTWVPGDVVGNEVFRLVAGANNLTFSGFDFYNVGQAFKLGADLSNITIDNMEADNVRYFIQNYVAGGATTASLDGLVVSNVEVHGFSQSVIRLQYDTHNVTIDNVYGDSEHQEGDNYTMGIMLDDTVHDVLIRNSTMMNASSTGTATDYWNGDGFTAERGVYNLRIEDCRAVGNTDGGFDLKSTSTVLVNTIAEDNGRNYRLWGQADLINPTGIDPHVRGGIASQLQIMIENGATVTVTGGQFVDSGSSTRVVRSEAGNSITFSGTKFVYAGTLTSGETGDIHGIDTSLVTRVGSTGLYSTNGEIYASAAAAPPPLLLHQFGDMSFAAPVFGASTGAGGWSSDGTYPRLLGDVNGDGNADVVGFGKSGVYVSLGNGAGAFAAPAFVLAAFGAEASAGGWSSNDS
jgi:hypothetical protein